VGNGAGKDYAATNAEYVPMVTIAPTPMATTEPTPMATAADASAAPAIGAWGAVGASEAVGVGAVDLVKNPMYASADLGPPVR
jgi:hypothetical protein